MDPMQQFFQNQLQLLENLTNTVANLQAQVNNHSQPPPQQSAPMNKHREFMSHRPPVFTHAADPLDANDWLKTVGKMLTIARCDDRQKVLFAAGRLQGSAGAWWDAYTTTHYLAGVHQQLQEPPHSCRADETEEEGVHLSPAGGMSVTEYQDRFIKLSRYAPEEVADDPKKQECFMEGLAGPLRYQLTSHTFSSFQHLLDKAITLEAMHIELGKSEEEGHYFCTVWEQHSSPFHSTAGDNTPCWRFRW
jgi:hypothetical protein